MKRLPWLLSALFLALPAHAADLLQIYRDALDNDPTLAAARATTDAGLERKSQGLAGLLPSLSLSGNTSSNHADISSGGVSFNRNYNSNSYTLSLSQPLFRWQNWVGYDQSKLVAAQAEAQFVLAQQDLMLRVAQAYFDVLYANENLKALKSQKTAISQQLEQAKKNFEVGTSTITDTHEAQSRYDLAQAQEIAGESDLEVKRAALQAIIGRSAPLLAPLRTTTRLSPPQPSGMDSWVQSAEQNSLSVQIKQLAADVAAKEVSRIRAGHFPTLDLVANSGKTANSVASAPSEVQFNNIGLQLTLPIYQGGMVSSQEREAAAKRQAALSDLDAARRSAALGARQSYLGVVNGLAQVRALEAAQVSSQSALDANKLGYDVGVRINIDVLNAEQQVYGTRRDLAKARLDTLMAQLKLKAAIGALAEADLQQINALLDSSAR
ncbi:MAG: hypothetical protein RIR00_1966 [Pseudomonadota bacterium]|jgi:outer membrane protein